MQQKDNHLRVQAWAQTDVGQQRKHNEDNYIVDLEIGLFGVADGMGGHAAGEIASETALRVVRTSVSSKIEKIRALILENVDQNRQAILSMIDHSVQESAKAVFELSCQKADSRGMGTTMSILVVIGNKGIIAHVGDSRIFLLRQNQLFQLTEDHSLVNEQLRMGLITEEEAERSPYKNVITRAVGAAENVKADTFLVEVLPKDRFMICSDGLHGYFEEGELAPHLMSDPPNQIPTQLITLSNHRGGKDNITCVFLSIKEPTPSRYPQPSEVTTRIDLLQKIPLFQHMTYQELVKLMNIAYLKTFEKGKCVLKEDEPGDVVFVIFQGQVGVFRKTKRIDTLKQGDHFGEIAFIDQAPRNTTIVTEQASQLLTLNRGHFIELMKQEQNIAVKVLWGFLKTMSSRLRHTTAKLTDHQ